VSGLGGNRQEPMVPFRGYQAPIFWSTLGLIVLLWSRQIGKSYTFGNWAGDRMLTRPGRLITVLSNSKDNGAEFNRKVAESCEKMNVAVEQEDLSADWKYENMIFESRIRVGGKWSRVHVLAANPRTARGFSGDLILDEFAFQENSVAIWDAAEPILSSNQDYVCRVGSTANGRYNMFYRMVAGALACAGDDNPAGISMSQQGFPVSIVRRSDAWRMGVKVYDSVTREPITPEEARAKALDKASYDQNYECVFNDENMILLTWDLISRAEYASRPGDPAECFICEGQWGREAIEFLRGCKGPLVLGMDVGRTRDLSTVVVGEQVGQVAMTRGMLRMANKRLPAQVEELRPILTLPTFGRGSIDATGIGLGVAEWAQEIAGTYRIEALNFASKEKRTVRGMEQEDSALVTELMALDGLDRFESGRVRIPCEQALRDALRKPERVQTAGGVKIAVERDEAGHADEFWALMLMFRAMKTGGAGAIASTAGIRMGGNVRGGRKLWRPRVLFNEALARVKERAALARGGAR
jgi:phage FluMu gp28-like protein